MEKMEIWNKVKDVPQQSQKKITGGRLKGMTDIKPQWRYKVMTETFGMIGLGWYYNIVKKEIIEGANGEKCGFVDVQLFVKHNDEWSKPIEGTGGSSFIANERNGAYTSDEVFKMALTDALSVSMAKIGVGASIYLGENSGGKYTQPAPPKKQTAPPTAPPKKKPVLVFGSEKFKSCIDWILEDEKRSIKNAKEHYYISPQVEEELKKAIMVKKELT